MFFFSLKKSFFDAWDNFGVLILGNISLLLILLAGLWPMFKILESGQALGFLFAIIIFPLFFIGLSVVAMAMSKTSDYQRVAFSDIPGMFSKAWGMALLFAGATTAFFMLSIFGIMYYGAMKTMVGLAAMALLFWVSVSVYLTVLWFFPVRNRLSGNFAKLLKKSALIMFDNLGLSLFAGFIMVPVQMLLWPFTAFGAFGPAGILLYFDGSLKLLIMKYDWLEEHPDAKRRDIPWFEILLDERERVGKRTFRGMIFPWKE